MDKNKKKIDINIPKLDDFIHKVYINVARKVYKNVYLFEIINNPLQTQKNNRELEIIIQECILNTIRESIPVEAILKAYMDETIEEDVVEEIKEEIIEEKIIPPPPPPQSEKIENISENISKLSFDNNDYVSDENNNITTVNAPKTLERLQELEEIRFQKKLEEDEDDNPKINILFDEDPIQLFPELLIDDIEILT